MSGEYAGESIAKKVARVRLYRRVRKMLRVNGQLDDVRCIFLIGPDAAEVGALRHILRANPENCLGIDRDAASCEMLARKWPGARSHHGDLLHEETIRRAYCDGWNQADFIHLDLMGLPSMEAGSIYGTFSQCSQPGTIAALTFLRGREVGELKAESLKYRAMVKTQWQRANSPLRSTTERKLAREFCRVTAADPVRTLQHMNLLENTYAWQKTFETICEIKYQDTGFDQLTQKIEELHEATNVVVKKGGNLLRAAFGVWVPIASYAYRGEVSPMGVVACQLLKTGVDENHGTSPWFKELADRSVDSSSVIKKDSMLDLLEEADSLEREFSKQQVAEILDVSPGTLAAWRAHRTMGAYV